MSLLSFFNGVGEHLISVLIYSDNYMSKSFYVGPIALIDWVLAPGIVRCADRHNLRMTSFSEKGGRSLSLGVHHSFYAYL
jgi:hypothetical protein